MTATRTGVVWSGLWAVAVIFIVFMVFVVSNTGDVRVSFAGTSGVLPLAVVLMAAMAAGTAVALILGTARLTQLRPLTRKRLR
ncbi:lipopolysaccharide assembly protein LapA domain-containing protein [Actinomadura citrea]|uniref:Putative integral membrane protein n=1 Tax=Actinomadura citrea TaxID=46158 RepID=A0A7Y9KC82_9ACTN|nr:lipopolysaccharide assembly protein LapA domain-containing protein [Actinomadura citrea]NYE10299.1 putative integral membrane protein [Actinomadura citrea]